MTSESKPTPLRILFVGDSITGYSDPSKHLKFSHIVEAMIEARYGEGHATVLNRGIGGNNTADLLARLPGDVLDARPDVVVMLIGGNDAGIGMPRATTAANLDNVLTQITAVCPRVLLLQYHVLPYPDCPEQAWEHLDDNNDLIAAAAAQHDCALLDMAAPMRAAVDNTVPADEPDYRVTHPWRGIDRYRSADLVLKDGVHPMCGGELVYARNIFAKLLELGWLDETHDQEGIHEQNGTTTSHPNLQPGPGHRAWHRPGRDAPLAERTGPPPPADGLPDRLHQLQQPR